MRRRRRRFTSTAFAIAVAAAAATQITNVDATTNQTLTSSPPARRLPWVVLTPHHATFQGRIEGDRDCLGLRISPSAALMAASCIQRHRITTTNSTTSDPVNVVAESLEESSAVEAGDVPGSGKSVGHWRLRDVASVLFHPQYEVDPVAYDIALIQWLDRKDQSSRSEPVLLDSIGDLTSDDRIVSLHQDIEIDAPVVYSETETCGHDTQCGVVHWESATSCSGSEQPTGFVLRIANDRSMVAGLLTKTLDCRDSDSVANHSHHRAAVSWLANARRFIEATSSGDHAWVPPSIPSEVSSGDDNRVDVGPPASPGSEKEAHSSSDAGDGDADIGDVHTSAAWRINFGSRYGYLSQHSDLPAQAPLPPDGGIAVLIAPQFVLTRASWIRDLAKHQWVHFAAETIRIQRVLSNGEDAQGDRLVVIELEHAIDDGGSPVYMEIPTTLPPIHTDIEALTTSAFNQNASSQEGHDHTLLVLTPFNAIEDRKLCGLPPPQGDDDLVCVQSSGRVGLTSRQYLPFNASFLFLDESLVGVSRSSSSTGSDFRVAQAYEPLGASHRVRSFLDDATNGTVLWTKKDVYVNAPDPLLLGQTVLYANGTSKEDSMIPCGVVPLTRRFFLTMASCLSDRQVAWVEFQSSEEKVSVEEEEVVELFPDTQADNGARTSYSNETTQPSWVPTSAWAVQAVVVHPIYEATQSTTYDFAIIELAVENEAPAFTTVQLMGDILATHSRVVEHRINSDGSEDDSSLVVDAVECGGVTSNRTICVIATASSTRCRKEQDALPVEDTSPNFHGLFYRVGATVLFVGFTKAVNGAACDVGRSYSQVATILNFINAIVDAPEWGSIASEAGTGIGAGAADFKYPGFAPSIPIATPLTKPYVVGLRLTKSGQNFCGGSLIAPQFVLTAAHCVTDGLAAWVSIGSSLSSGFDENAEPIAIVTTRTRIHPQYHSPYAFSHDAAILELAVPAYAPSIVLDTTPNFRDGVAATMYGYGVESATSTVLSPVMHERTLELLSKTTCTQTLPNIDDTVLCALARSGLDACTGDSGSPLVVQDPQSGEDRLVGVVSAGYGCGIAGVPGLYTRVASIAEFVNAYVVDPVWLGDGGRGSPHSGGNREPSEPSTRTPADTSSRNPGATQTPPSSPEEGTNGVENRGGTSVTGDSSSESYPPSSSSSTDVSRLPLEDRNGSPSDSSSMPSSLLPPATATRTSAFQAQIFKTPLPDDAYTVFTRAKLLSFLLGHYPYSMILPTLVATLASPANAMTFFSSGDVRPLLVVVAAHNATPLNQRHDRFGRAERFYESSLVSTTECVAVESQRGSRGT